MSSAAITLVLIAAIAHASWNLFSKQASDVRPAYFNWLLSAAATAIYAPVVAVAVTVTSPRLSALSWAFMIGTGFLHSGYFWFLQLGYARGDLSAVYPAGRGTGALLAALAGIVLLGERPGPVSIAGIAAITAGIILLGLPQRRLAVAAAVPADGPTDGPAGLPAVAEPVPVFQALLFAFITGVFICGYTIWDKYAVSVLHTPPLLQGLAGFPLMVMLFSPAVLRDRAGVAAAWRKHRAQVIGGAVLSPLAYFLVLIALSFTAVSAVAPAREVSVLFGVLLGRRLLDEGGLARRLTAATAIVAGIVAIAVG